LSPNRKIFEMVLDMPITSDDVSRHGRLGPCWTPVEEELIVIYKNTCYDSQDTTIFGLRERLEEQSVAVNSSLGKEWMWN
jgi:hypothetical protein